MKNLSDTELQKSITEPAAIIADRSGALKAVKIIKKGDDFCVFLKLSWEKDYIYLSTARKKSEPRRFRDIGRLLEYVEKNYSSISKLTLVLQKN